MSAVIFTKQQAASSLLIGSSGALILGLQPVLLGALISESRVTFDEVALIATVEMIAIGIGSVLFPALTSHRQMRIKAALLVVLASIGHYLTADAATPGMLAMVRGATGLIEGALLAVAVELVVRSQSPGRMGGWFVAIQTVMHSALVLVLALWVMPAWGSQGGFKVLAGAALLVLAFIPVLANDYGELPVSENSGAVGTWHARPLIALFVIFSLYLFIGAIWAFLEPLGMSSGLDAPAVGLIVSITLLIQVVGALVATALEDRIGYAPVLGGAALCAVLIAIGLGSTPSQAAFWALSLAVGFIWLFVVPWQIAMTVAADSTRKTALLVPAAQLFGAALGPVGATLAMTGGQIQSVAWFAAGAAMTSFLGVALLVARRRSGRVL